MQGRQTVRYLLGVCRVDSGVLTECVHGVESEILTGCVGGVDRQTVMYLLGV